jgi:hypothetical protein
MNRLDRLLSAALAMLGTAHVAAAQPVVGGFEPSVSPRPEAVTARAAIGSLSGFVSDDRGVPLIGVMVSATGATVAFAVTDPVGKYTFDKLPSGGYLLRAHLSGFVTSRREFVEIRASAETVRLIQLRRSAEAVGTTGCRGRDPSARRTRLAAASSQAQRAEGRVGRDSRGSRS